MIFGKKKDDSIPGSTPTTPIQSSLEGMTIVSDEQSTSQQLLQEIQKLFPHMPLQWVAPSNLSATSFHGTKHILAVFQPNTVLNNLLELLISLRASQQSGFPTLLVVTKPTHLRALGTWLSAAGDSEKLEGTRLIVAKSETEIAAQLSSRFSAVQEPNIIRMPTSTEVECNTYKSFFAISDHLRHIVKLMKELAENNISRVYLLGAPGAGKTTLAYYYYLCRDKGNFVAVNLTAESTGDKESMKSLLCGHVPGALPGSGSREGAFSFAGDGLCFLDESHGVTGVVMQVLMEALDSGQYLPYGATKKRALECAVIFASNRSWEALREMMNLDEHARLGATIIKLIDLAAREEDLIAVLANTLENFAKKCTTWKAPQGITAEAWEEYRRCRWRGNTRTLIRVTETAAVSFATAGSPDGIIDVPFVREGIDLWEPETHSTADMYVSFRPDEKKPDAPKDPTTTARIAAQH